MTSTGLYDMLKMRFENSKFWFENCRNGVFKFCTYDLQFIHKRTVTFRAKPGKVVKEAMSWEELVEVAEIPGFSSQLIISNAEPMRLLEGIWDMSIMSGNIEMSSPPGAVYAYSGSHLPLTCRVWACRINQTNSHWHS